MARNWTEAQRAAINERNRTLLVSAAAGSGKTAVLTERIIQSLTDPEHPADISRILVVTFTRAAAGELRARISKALTEALALQPSNRHLAHQLMLLGGAAISTIDSFYLDLVKAHFEATELPASFRMADDAELLPLQAELMRATLDCMYAAHPDFHRLADIFGTLRSEEPFTEALLEIYRKLSTYTEGLSVISRSAREIENGAYDPLSTPYGRVFLRELTALASEGHTLFARMAKGLALQNEKVKKKLGAVVLECNEYFTELLGVIDHGSYADIHALLNRPFTQRVGGGAKPTEPPDFCALWELADEFRKGWGTQAARFAAFSPEETAQSAAESAVLLELLHATLTHFDRAYRAEKLRREIAEFSDVARAAYLLLVEKDGSPTALARELSDSFDAIYIDEYQDVNAMQDATFRAIATERNRFMVGDIKQSIYSFRGARPAIFADYRRAFSPLDSARESDAPEASVQMSNCFRCDRPVIDFSNTVSGFLFERCRDSLGYCADEDDLVFSKNEPEIPSPKCRLVLIEPQKKPTFDSPEEEQRYRLLRRNEPNGEMRWIACEIQRLLAEGRKSDGSRITAGDIAVLARNTAFLTRLHQLLDAMHIPTGLRASGGLFEHPEVLCMYSLLCTIDNPMHDIHLAATLRSPFFGFTLEDLVRLRNGADRALTARCADFLARLRRYRELAEKLPVDRLLRALYRETAALAMLAQKKSTHDRGALDRLYEYARCFEGSGYKGLYAFLRSMESVMQNGSGSGDGPDRKDAVSLITVHHSKGLEFPVCFVANAASPFNTEDADPPFLTDESIGCALMLPNAGPFSRAQTFWRAALSMELARRNLEQEMRVLYVGMTRAREQLYVTARPTFGAEGPRENAKQRALADALFPAHTLFPKGRCYLDWILTALALRDTSTFLEQSVFLESELPTREELCCAAGCTEEPEQEPYKQEDEPSAIRRLRERFSFTYPHAHLTRLPAKLSVSRLTPEVLDVFDSDGAPSPADQRAPDDDALLERFSRLPFSVASTPDAASRGTATHEFLQFCDFTRAAKSAKNELERLIEAGFLPETAREAVRMNELERFFESDFYRSLAGATELHRETRFHIFLPAALFTANADFARELDGERLAVQGVIDLFYTDAKGTLVVADYKTDRLTPAELADPALAAKTLGARHGEQLAYYALALRELCGRAPDRVQIYSLPLGAALDIALPEIGKLHGC